MTYRTVVERDDVRIMIDPDKVVGFSFKQDEKGYSITLSFGKTDKGFKVKESA